MLSIYNLLITHIPLMTAAMELLSVINLLTILNEVLILRYPEKSFQDLFSG